MSQFTVCPLEADRIREAYLLVRSAAAVSEESWVAFARAQSEQGAGVLAVLAEDDHVHGIATYRALDTLRYKRCLFVEVIVTFELMPGAPVRKALCAALDAVARNLGCLSLIFTVKTTEPGDAISRKTAWKKLGFKAETIGFVRIIDQSSETTPE